MLPHFISRQVDVYRTLHELLEVPLPTAETHAIEGNSLVPLLHDPEQTKHPNATSLKSWVPKPGLTQYPRCPRTAGGAEKDDWEKNSCIHSTDSADFGWMGYSMALQHTDGHSYRFTMWPRWNGSILAPIWADVRAIELYNHSDVPAGSNQSEFDALENVNIANGGGPYWDQANENPLVGAFTPLLKKSFGF
jgi:hypothetical protein